MKRYSLWERSAGWGAWFFFIFLLPPFPTLAPGATFDIHPTRIFLDGKTKLEKLIIKNVGDSDFPVQVKAYKWTQDEKGDDLYEETEDIITFPKILSVKKGEEKVIRIGTNTTVGAVEKTYRIYVEEIPSPEQSTEGANVRLYMKVGVPLFMKPAKNEEQAEIESFSMKNGQVAIKVRNRGNAHLIATHINLSGEDGQGKSSFSQEIGGWYILGGAFKTYEIEIPTEACQKTTKLNVEVKTNNALTLRESLSLDARKCDKPTGSQVGNRRK
jgi:fimbrial chaperone protein